MQSNGELLYFQPKSIIVGLGSRRGIPKSVLRTEVEAALEEKHLNMGSIRALACVKNRYNEEGICMLAKELRIPVFTYNIEELENLSGYGSICDRAAMAACKEISDFSRLMFKKRIENGIILTAAVIWRK